MDLCHDFTNEEGMFQHIAKCIGVEVLLTPKCHAELAGEGVEYVWDGAKGELPKIEPCTKEGGGHFQDQYSSFPT